MTSPTTNKTGPKFSKPLTDKVENMLACPKHKEPSMRTTLRTERSEPREVQSQTESILPEQTIERTKSKDPSCPQPSANRAKPIFETPRGDGDRSSEVISQANSESSEHAEPCKEREEPECRRSGTKMDEPDRPTCKTEMKSSTCAKFRGGRDDSGCASRNTGRGRPGCDNPCNGEGESRFATSSAKGAESHQLHPCGSKDKSRALGPKIEMDKFNREEPCSSSKKPGCKKSRANEQLSNLAKPTIRSAGPTLTHLLTDKGSPKFTSFTT